MLSGADPIPGDRRRDARPDAHLALGRAVRETGYRFTTVTPKRTWLDQEGAFSLHPLRARAGRAAASTAG